MRNLALVAGLTLGLATSAGAAPIIFTADLTGAAESTPVATPGHGTAVIFLDPVAHTLRIVVDFEDLIGTTTAAFVHCCTAVPGTGNAAVAMEHLFITGFPLGVTSGAYDRTFFTLLSTT